MSKIKLAVIYYSSTGTNYEMAQAAVQAARQAGAEVRLLKIRETAPQEAVNSKPEWKALTERTQNIPEVTLADLEWADAYLFSTPTRYGGAASQTRAFMDSTGPLWATGKLANKLVSVMTSAQNPNGGQETTLQNMYISLMHWGAILVPPGYTDQSIFQAGGNPYGTSVTATGQGVDEASKKAIEHQTRRLLEVARFYLSGRENSQQVSAD
ncbi:NAD(P)H:quinone oxidoreductase [Deinococcus cellulosilyticus]|uniref:NAD(P)H dehydrogenase (Quinone) n=1 Tax=Deinococcus cellulosilyticus (strain DSM 18568 / NBRC 106333 / KACC 11606 / 5516J-15) TaxID=1223518 RepID=A0A511N6R6_DEIC1|nr:NAD(P)H:quinone oxidoreductase [Deinococcus cellulosilyticus]GEM48126.1 NAD(P)H dehydrogenase (quinone) [Deinococcus cellulosilyticus NBRC 106333 = KACC 11606]